MIGKGTNKKVKVEFERTKTDVEQLSEGSDAETYTTTMYAHQVAYDENWVEGFDMSAEVQFVVPREKVQFVGLEE